MGIQNAVGNVAGMTAPVVTGYLVQHTGHYTSALIVSGVVALCGVVAWLVVVPEVQADRLGRRNDARDPRPRRRPDGALSSNATTCSDITEPARDIDVVHETDVLVVGSGPGGLAAALAAARAGVRTTLLERYGCFGGNITQVGVEGFAWYRHEATIDSEGIGIEFEERAKSMGAAMPEPQSISHALDAEMFKYVADVLVQEAGVQPMLHRQFVAPIVEDGAIRGVITESKAGREAILAQRVIDGTGDADVAARAGAMTHKTPREEMMSASVMFSMTGVNKQRFIDAVKADPQTYKDWVGSGEWHIETTGQGRRTVLAFPAQAVQAGRARRV